MISCVNYSVENPNLVEATISELVKKLDVRESEKVLNDITKVCLQYALTSLTRQTKDFADAIRAQSTANIVFNQVIVNKSVCMHMIRVGLFSCSLIVLGCPHSASTIAQHITVIDHSLFKAISLEELFGMSWAKEITNTPNLNAMVNRWNNV